MKTELMLEKRALYSWAYLPIALILIACTIIPTRFTIGMQANWSQGYFFLIWITAALYFIHFIYGAFYYPNKYKCLFEGETYYVDKNSDMSAGRAWISNFIVLLLFACQPGLALLSRPLFTAQLLIFLLAAICWLLFSRWLKNATQTENLFNTVDLLIDRHELMPELQESEKKELRYKAIRYSLPLADDKDAWERAVMISYAKSERERAEHEKQKNAQLEILRHEASEKSRKIAQVIK